MEEAARGGRLVVIEEGGFSFLPGGMAYSQGVRAEPGFSIEHVRFPQSVGIDSGFELIEDYLRSRSRPLASLCAVELRSPEALSMDGFREVNGRYAAILERWGLVRNGINAIARSNVAPVHHRPPQVGFFAFSFTVPTWQPRQSFVVAGSSEWPEGGRFPEDVVCFGDTSREALRKKVQYVFAAMRRRVRELGVSWTPAALTQFYSVHDQFEFLSEELASGGGGPAGVVWHYCRPPVVGWEVEMDIKDVQASRLFDRIKEES